MDDRHDSQKYSREPTLDDLVILCRHLNEENVNYVVIGGFAIVLNGYIRTTGDIDLLVDASPGNIGRLKKALLYLPDQAIREVSTSEVEKYEVVRVADEIVIDLMQKACNVTYDEAKDSIQYYNEAGVNIPYLAPRLLWKTKNTHRPKDIEDRMFLQRLINIQSKKSEYTSQVNQKLYQRISKFLKRMIGIGWLELGY